MCEFFSRTKLLLGRDNIKKIKKSHVIVFGIGGVGSFIVESLIRIGINEITLVDNDIIKISDLNRQIHSNLNVLNCLKIDAMKDRIKTINKNIKVNLYNDFYSFIENDKIFTNKKYDYIADAIDNINSKVDLILTANKLNIPIISSMGFGNKIEPTKIVVSDIYKTNMDPIARIIRKKLKRENIKKLKVVFSKEKPIKLSCNYLKNKKIIGSVPFVPSVAGLIMASEIIKDIIGI